MRLGTRASNETGGGKLAATRLRTQQAGMSARGPSVVQRHTTEARAAVSGRAIVHVDASGSATQG